jgi:hypothetical protein
MLSKILEECRSDVKRCVRRHIVLCWFKVSAKMEKKRISPIIQVAFMTHHTPTITSCCNGTSWINMDFCVEFFTLTVHENTEIKPIIIAEHYKLAVQTPQHTPH